MQMALRTREVRGEGGPGTWEEQGFIGAALGDSVARWLLLSNTNQKSMFYVNVFYF